MKLGIRKDKHVATKRATFMVRVKMSIASCFDFRMRASSFDMHQLAQRHKLAKFTKIFRSRSDTNVKGSSSAGSSPLVSPKDSPTNSPGGQPRRRFARVVKDAERQGEEYENPHIIRRYTPGYVEEKFVPMQKWNSMEEASALPYDPQEDSILKKGLSIDTTLSASEGSTGEQSPPVSSCEKHASFKEEVDVIEYDKKGKIQKCVCLKHKERLHDDSDSDFLEDLPEDDKENSSPEEEKSLKDASLKDIVNAEKAVNRDDDDETPQRQPIKMTKRQEEVDIPDQVEEDEEVITPTADPALMDSAAAAAPLTAAVASR